MMKNYSKDFSGSGMNQMKTCLYLQKYARLFIHLKAQILIQRNQSLISWHPSLVSRLPNCIGMLESLRNGT